MSIRYVGSNDCISHDVKCISGELGVPADVFSNPLEVLKPNLGVIKGEAKDSGMFRGYW